MDNKKLLTYSAFVLGLLATLMIFLPALKVNDTTYTGLNIAIGKELLDVDFFGLGSVASARLPFNFFILAAYSFPLIAGIVALLSKRLSLLSTALFAIAAVVFLTVPTNVDIHYTVAGTSSTSSVDWSMAYGLIIASVLSAIGAVASFFQAANN